MLKAGRGRVLVTPLGDVGGEYKSSGGIVVPRPKPVRRTKGGEMEHKPIAHGVVVDVGAQDMHSRGGAPDIHVSDIVYYNRDHGADVWVDGKAYQVIVGLNVLAFESRQSNIPEKGTPAYKAWEAEKADVPR